jgi:cysteine desulfurase
MDCIYLDNNATTPQLPAVTEAMQPFLGELYGNPASAHRAGRRARQAFDDARERVAQLLDAHPDEVVFTSGATEANNLAIFGLAGKPPGHIIASPLEHPSVLEPIRHLAAAGFAVDWLPVGLDGTVHAEALSGLIRPDTRLIAVMLVNHETGAVQPIADCRLQIADLPSNLQSAICNLQFHCDAVQAVGKQPLRFGELGVTTLSLSAHKFHGPKGVGALLVRRGSHLAPRTWGGHQQQGRRPGTEPVALAVGLARALELWHEEADARTDHVQQLRRRFLDQLRAAAPVVLNGPVDGGVPHAVNVSFPGCRAESLLMNLDLAGVACSTGSACSSGSLLPSPVLRAMGVSEAVLHTALRFSLSFLLTEAEIDEAARRITTVVNRLRRAEGE